MSNTNNSNNFGLSGKYNSGSNTPVEEDIIDADLDSLDLKEDTWLKDSLDDYQSSDNARHYNKSSAVNKNSDSSYRYDSTHYSGMIEIDDNSSDSDDYTEDEADEIFDKAEKRDKIVSIIRKVILVIAACTFCYSAFMLFQIFSEYKRGDDIYEQLEAEILKEDDTVVSVPMVEGEGEIEVPFRYDHKALLAANHEGIGYIHIPSLNVKYPIAKTDNNDYYLTHTFTREVNSSGAIFEDYRIDGELDASHVILHGHRMQHKGMFGILNKYLTESFYRKGDNEFFYLYTGNKVMQYKIFSVHITAPVGETYSINFDNLTELREYAAKMKGLSKYDTGVDISNATQVVSLSTCIDTENGTDRLVVHAIYVGEAPLDYSSDSSNSADNTNSN